MKPASTTALLYLALSCAPATASAFAPDISFERNDGQFRQDVLFMARGARGEVAIRSGMVSISGGNGYAPAMRLELKGANPAPEVAPLRPLATRSHYYRGSMRRDGVPHFGEVRLADVYPQIDLALHGARGALEYDFIVAPGADPADIRLDLGWADRASIDASGNLALQAGAGTLRQMAPIAYQMRGGERTAVAARFELRFVDGQQEAGFGLGEYDRSLPLVIDPIMVYSTYLGGPEESGLPSMALDPDGNIYLASSTQPTLLSPSSGVNITKFDPASNTVVYSTTLDGSGYDVARGIALGSAGGQFLAHVTGSTNSPDFPNCHLEFPGDPQCPALAGSSDAFLAVLNADGTLARSRLIGGTAMDAGTAIAIDPQGGIHLAGTTTGDFPTTPRVPYPNRIGTVSGDRDGWVALLDSGLSILRSTYLGGSGDDNPLAIAADANANTYVSGGTTSTDFPTLNAFSATLSQMYGAFLAKLDSSGNIAFSTYVGRTGSGAHVATDGTQVAVAGNTLDPVAGPSLNISDASVMRFTSAGAFIGETTFGGSFDEQAYAVAIAGGYVYVVGQTGSVDFPETNPLSNWGTAGFGSTFIARIGPTGLDFVSRLGGSGYDQLGAVAVRTQGANVDAWVAGTTTSTDFPTVRPYQATLGGNRDLFLSRISFARGPAEDFNLDGKPDLLWRNTASGNTYLWTMNGAAVASDAFVAGIDPSWSVQGIADFNGDGKPDLVWRNAATGNTYVWYMDGSLLLSDTYLFSLDPVWKIEAVADFNQDGKPDFLMRNASTGLAFVWLFDNAVAKGDQYLFTIDPSWKVEAVADMGKDGQPDLLFRNTTSGLAFIWNTTWSGGTVGLGEASDAIFSIDPAWEVAQVADWNGDGNPDLVFRNSATGVVFVWFWSGSALTGSAAITQIDPSWEIVPRR